MIPQMNHSGVLPPFVGSTPGQLAGMAPYLSSILEVTQRFSGTSQRNAIMRGLLDYRAQLRNAGIDDGFQWIDGSFVEECEHWRGRPPADVDIVTFANRPPAYTIKSDWDAFVDQNRHLFDRALVKSTYRCDSYYVDMHVPRHSLVNQSVYFFGLFSHQRVSYLWKGLLQVPLQSDDSQALALIGGILDASQT